MEDLQTAQAGPHIRQIKSAMEELIDHLRDDVHKVDEPQAKALFETSAEVIQGLVTTFSHYEVQEEEAWKVH